MKRKKLLNIPPIAMLAMSMIAILGPTMRAAPVTYADAISIVPPKIYESDVFCTYNETEFTVEVVVTNITGCAGYIMKIDYNATLLEMTSWTFDTDPANPLTPTQMAPASANRIDTDSSVPGSVKISTVWRAGVPTYTYSGDSVAAEITFKIIYCPPQIVGGPPAINNTVSCDLAFDPAWTRATDYWGDDILFAALNDGYYEYTTVGRIPGAAEAISIDPPTVIYESDVFCIYNNTQFTVEVVITNITDCAGYQFKIDYNDTLLEVTNINLDTDPPNPMSPTQMAPASANRIDTDSSTPGHIQMATVWKAGVPTYNYTGDSVAAEITFKIIYCPPQVVGEPQVNTTVWSDLAFDTTWTRASDYWGDDMLFSTFNGGYYEYTTVGRIPDPPVADFTWSPPFPYEGVEVTCTDQSQPNGGEINAWLWEIEGPATNTTAMDGPVMKFLCDEGGYVNVTLTVWDTEGVNATITKQIYASERGRAILFVHQSVSTVTISETFKIGVIVNNVIDLTSFEFKLAYNTTILDAIEVWVMWPDSYVINETAGIVWVNASCPYPYPFSGNGTLAAITFTAVEFGSCVLDLHNTTLVDFYAVSIPHDAFDGYIAVTPIHDVAIVNVAPSATEAYPTWTVPLDIKVVVINEGNINETFDVTVYYDLTATEWVLIGNQTVINLAAGENKTLTFSWNVTGLSVGTYVINATASIITGEVDTEDNTLTCTVKIKLPGDVDGDGDVDVSDQRKMQNAMFTAPGDDDWNPNADIDGDGDVDVGDQREQQLHMFEMC